MSQRWPQLIIMISGAVLMLVSIILIAVQFSHELAQPEFAPRTRSLEAASYEGALKLTTNYIGLVVIAPGALLEIVGYVATLPWRESTKP
jgi:uncharacterized membrane protein